MSQFDWNENAAKADPISDILRATTLDDLRLLGFRIFADTVRLVSLKNLCRLASENNLAIKCWHDGFYVVAEDKSIKAVWYESGSGQEEK